MEHVVWVPGQPQGKGRPRATAMGGRVRLYTPEATARAENWAATCWLQQLGHTLLDGPLDVTLVAVCAVPKSYSKAKAAQARAMQLRPTGKPDTDNLVKLYLDGLNGVAWGDDAQVVGLTSYKLFGDAPGVLIRVRPAEPVEAGVLGLLAGVSARAPETKSPA